MFEIYFEVQRSRFYLREISVISALSKNDFQLISERYESDILDKFLDGTGRFLKDFQAILMRFQKAPKRYMNDNIKISMRFESDLLTILTRFEAISERYKSILNILPWFH
jgi:hypothetical protein